MQPSLRFAKKSPSKINPGTGDFQNSGGTLCQYCDAKDLKRPNVHVRPSHGRAVESLEGNGRQMMASGLSRTRVRAMSAPRRIETTSRASD